MSALAESRAKNADSALMLLGPAIAAGDAERTTLARAVLAECGAPGGEGAPSIEAAVTAIPEAVRS